MPNGIGTPEAEGDRFIEDVELSEEMRARARAEYGRGRRRMEILRLADTPQAIIWAARHIIAVEEKQDLTEPPNRWTRNSVDELFDDRADELRLRLEPERFVDKEGWNLQELIHGVSFDKKGEKVVGEESLSEDELKALIDALEEAKKEFWVRARLLEAYRQMRRAGMDLEEVTVKLFTSLWKVYPEAGWLATIGQAKETLPGAEKLGVMIDQALHLWCDVGEQTDEIKKAGIPNIFAGPRFEATYQRALDFITNRLLARNGIDVPRNERRYSLYWQDAQNAARLALQIFRLFDLDVAYDLSCSDIKAEDRAKWEKGLKSFLLHSPGATGGEWSFEGGMNSGDLAKICHFILRQVNEFGRDYPRTIGAPATIGCFPNLTVDTMRMITVEAKTQEEDREKVEKVFSLWTLWRQHKIAFGDLPWGEEEWKNGVEILRQAGLISDEEADREWKISGISQDSYDVPKTLQHFYAVGTVFSFITRKDWDKAFEDIQNPNFLYGLNKGFEVAFAVMIDGLGLRKLERGKKTMTKLRQLAKVNSLIGVFAANTQDYQEQERRKKGVEYVTATTTASASALRRGELEGIYGVEASLKTQVENAIEAAERGFFLSSANPEQKEQLEAEKKLIARALGPIGILASFAPPKDKEATRRGFLPSETGWFDETELMAIKASGLYGPYNKI